MQSPETLLTELPNKVVYRRDNSHVLRECDGVIGGVLSSSKDTGQASPEKEGDGKASHTGVVVSSPGPPLFNRFSLYERIRDIGSGCFGKAVLVRDRATRKPYVMKMIDVTALGPKERRDAVNEAQVLASLRHPYIISYKDSFVENGKLCIVTDYADGGDLYRAVAAYRKAGAKGVPEPQLLRWFTQATLALKYLHDRHILHRDIKSQNLFLMSSGRLRLGDFGIAKMLDGTLAFAKTQVGTPYYLSPEICRNKPYSWAADIWSLGCILFELASLRVPFDAPNLAVLVEKITRHSPPSFPETYSPAVRRLYVDCMQRDWQRRPSAADILLREVIQNEIRRMLLEEQQKRRKTTSSCPISEASSILTVSTTASSGLNAGPSTTTTVDCSSQKQQLPPKQRPSSSDAECGYQPGCLSSSKASASPKSPPSLETPEKKTPLTLSQQPDEIKGGPLWEVIRKHHPGMTLHGRRPPQRRGASTTGQPEKAENPSSLGSADTTKPPHGQLPLQKTFSHAKRYAGAGLVTIPLRSRRLPPPSTPPRLTAKEESAKKIASQ